MNVTLAPNLEAIIKRKVDDGLYEDTNAALDAAVRLLDEHDRRQRLLAALDEGRQGGRHRITPELFAHIRRDAERMAETGQEPDQDVCP